MVSEGNPDTRRRSRPMPLSLPVPVPVSAPRRNGVDTRHRAVNIDGANKTAAGGGTGGGTCCGIRKPAWAAIGAP